MLQQVTYTIPAMDCINEENQIRGALKGLASVHALEFTLSERKLTVTMAPDAEADVVERLVGAGFQVQTKQPFKLHEQMRITAGLLLALGAEIVEIAAPEAGGYQLTEKVLAAAAILAVGVGVFKKGVRSIFRGRLDINALMTVAVIGAFVIGEWPEAAMVASLFALAEFIEAKAVDRARRSIRSLLQLVPETAEIMVEGEWKKVDTKRVQPGSEIRVRPGARIPLDGMISKGLTTIDQSPVTGESMPVERGEGDKVYAGTINTSSMIVLRSEGEAGESMIDRIISLVETTQSKKAPVERFVDRFARIYTPIIFLLALVLAAFGPLIFPLTYAEAIYQSLALLVIACPCALVISTPVAIVSALASAARGGVLIKGGHALERLGGMRSLALDKTGTITEGRPALAGARIFGPQQEEAARSYARSLAGQSDHPVSIAIYEGLANAPFKAVTNFTALPGKGVEGEIAGDRVLLGNAKLLPNPLDANLQLDWNNWEEQGHSVSVLIVNGIPTAIFSVADKIKASSSVAVSSLKRLGVHVEMLSGDNQATAKAVGAAVGISDVQAALLPEAKVNAIKALQSRHGVVGMSGDGINDAPALAQADIGFAMGKLGTDTAKESADVILLGDDLRKIADMVTLAQKARRVLYQNIIFAITVKLAFIALTLTGKASMWMAVFADVGASLIVVANSLTLMKQTGRAEPRSCEADSACKENCVVDRPA